MHAVNCGLLLYADDAGLIFQHMGINIIEQQLIRNFSKICNWFVDNKLSIYFSEDRTKSILFAPLNKCKKLCEWNIYGSMKSSIFAVSEKSVALNVVSKINTRLKSIYGKKRFLSPKGNHYVMCFYSLILIMHAQFGIPNSTKNSN